MEETNTIEGSLTKRLRTVFELRRIEHEWISPLDPASYGTARFLLLRGLGLIYLVALYALQQQLYGLISSEGCCRRPIFRKSTPLLR